MTYTPIENAFYPPPDGRFKIAFSSFANMRVQYMDYSALFKNVASVCFVICVTLASPALAGNSKAKIQEANQMVQTFAGPDEPGIAIAVLRDGELIFSGVRGLARLDTKRPITPDTAFCIGSVSKQFTAFAAQLLIADGKLSLDSDARELVPELAHYDEPILVRDLIHHSSGLKDIWSAFSLMGQYETDAFEHEHIQKIIARYDDLNFSPGSNWSYSNSGYSVLADVVKAASGESFPSYMTRRVFTPIGMTRSSVRERTSDIRSDAAVPYSKGDEDQWERVPFGYASHGASGVWTTITDLGRWLNNMADPIAPHKEAMERMFDLGLLRNGEEFHYASGLLQTNIAGQPAFRHSGHDQEFKAALVYLPEIKSGVVAIANRNSGTVSLANKIASIFFDTGAPDPRLVGAPEDNDQSASGVYLSAGGAGLAIAVEEDGMTLKSPNDTIDLRLHSNDSLTINGQQTPFGAFQRDTTGAIVLLSFPFRGTGTMAPVLFYKQSDNYAPMSLDAIKSAGFEGRYFSDELEVFVEIDLDESGLTIQNFRELRPLSLKAFGPDTFQVSWPAPAYTSQYTLHFQRDEDGAVTGFSSGDFVAFGVNFEKITDR